MESVSIYEKKMEVVFEDTEGKIYTLPVFGWECTTGNTFGYAQAIPMVMDYEKCIVITAVYWAGSRKHKILGVNVK